jgi:acid stress-induced BolA-like protein IbaG/YrbA
MTLEEIQKKLESGIEQSQRIVLAVVSEEIKSGELHALSVKTYTPEER